MISKYIHLSKLATFFLACSLTQTGYGQESAAIIAYEQLVNSKTFPKYSTQEDLDALHLIRQTPDDVVARLKTVFSKGGIAEKNAKAIFGMLPVEKRLEIARESVNSYPLGTENNPLLGYIAYHGDQEDIKRIESEIAVANDDRKVNLTRCLADSKSPYCQKALIELRTKVPGNWQKTPEIKKIFDSIGE